MEYKTLTAQRKYKECLSLASRDIKELFAKYKESVELSK